MPTIKAHARALGTTLGRLERHQMAAWPYVIKQHQVLRAWNAYHQKLQQETTHHKMIHRTHLSLSCTPLSSMSNSLSAKRASESMKRKQASATFRWYGGGSVYLNNTQRGERYRFPMYERK